MKINSINSSFKKISNNTVNSRKEAKEVGSKDKREESARSQRIAAQQKLRKQREKDAERVQAVQQWNAQKEREKGKVVLAQHSTPWRNGPGKEVTVTRDEMLMANIKHKKDKMKQGVIPKQSFDEADNITEVEFVK